MIDYVNLKAEDMTVTCKLQKLKDVPPHYHDDYVTLLYVLDGQLEVFSGSFHLKMKAGDFTFINKREVHYTVNGIDNNVIVAHIKVKENSFYSRKENYLPNELERYILALAYLENSDLLVEENEYMELCAKVTSLIEQIFVIKAPEKSRVNVKEVCRYLHNNYAKKISLEEMSVTLGISPIHLTNLLKNAGAGTFSEYLSDIRCREAECLLLNTDLSVQKIADRCGFSSVQTFIKTYKNFSGRTPLQQRKHYKELLKHKFNRIRDCTSYYAVERITRCLGELSIKSILEGVRKLDLARLK